MYRDCGWRVRTSEECCRSTASLPQQDRRILVGDDVDVDTTAAQVELLVVVHVADVLRHLRVRLRSFRAQNARITAVCVLREGPALVLEPPLRADAGVEVLSHFTPVSEVSTTHITLEVAGTIERNPVHGESERSQMTLSAVEDPPDSGLVRRGGPDPVGWALAGLLSTGTMGDRCVAIHSVCSREIDRHPAVSVLLGEVHPVIERVAPVHPAQVDNWHPDQSEVGLMLLCYFSVYGLWVDSGIISGGFRRRHVTVLDDIVVV